MTIDLEALNKKIDEYCDENSIIHVRVYDLDSSVVPYSGIYIIPRDNSSLDDAKLILQTKRFYEYLLTKGVKVSGDSIRISSKDVEEYRY